MALLLRKHEKAKDGDVVDKRFQWLELRVTACLKLRPVELKKIMDNEDNHQNLTEFLDVPSRLNVFIVGTSSTTTPYVVISGEYDHSKRYTLDIKRKIMYFIKMKKEKLDDDKTFNEKIIYGDCNVDILQNIYDLSQHFILPLIKVPEHVKHISKVHISELMEETNSFLADSLETLGRSHNRTFLSLPPLTLPEKLTSSKESIDQDLVHELQQSVVRWADLMRVAITTSPESLAKPSVEEIIRTEAEHGGAPRRKEPGPEDDIVFWEEKKANLYQIEAQLTHPFIVKVIVMLRKSENAYAEVFEQVITEVHESLLEASEIVRYLRPLRPYLQAITPSSANKIPIHEIGETNTFKIIFTLLLTVWNESRAFSFMPRMAHFISEICNELMKYAIDALNELDIFNAEPEDSVKLLMLILNVCGDFKMAYFDAKAKAAADFSHAWKFQNTALFRRLDTLLERLHDILDIIETTVLFTKTANVRMGGAESIRLCQTIDAVCEKYDKERQKLHTITMEEITDIEDPAFDILYNDYRKAIIDLEQELFIVATTASKDTEAIFDLFRIFDSFEGFIDRPVGRQKWIEEQPELLNKWHAELIIAQNHFDEFCDGDKCVTFFPNVSRVAAILMWTYGLQQRLDVVNGHMMGLDKEFLSSTKGLECAAIREQLTMRINELVNSTLKQWSTTASRVSAEKLKCPLLVYDAPKREFGVNFEPELAMILKESIYIEARNADDQRFQLPPQVTEVSEIRGILRNHVLKLQMISDTYNHVNNKLKAAEFPLVKEEANMMAHFLQRGVGGLHWINSSEVEGFIAKGLEQVQRLEREMQLMQGPLSDCLKKITDFAAEDHFFPLLPSKSDVRVLKAKEFNKKTHEWFINRQKCIDDISTDCRVSVNTVFEEINTIKNNGGFSLLQENDNMWVDFVTYFSDEVCQALCDATAISLTGFRNQLDAEYIQTHNGIPLLDIRITLSHPPNNRDTSLGLESMPDIVFDPALWSMEPPETIFSHEEARVELNDLVEEKADTHRVNILSVEVLLNQYLQNVLGLTGHFSNLASVSDTYRLNVESNPQIKKLLANITALISEAIENAEKEIKPFFSYSYLFIDKVSSSFANFLTEKSAENEVNKFNDPTKFRKPVPYFDSVPLEEYEAKIRHYEELHEELSELPMSCKSGFLKIDTKPLRNTLLDLGNMWRDVYARHIGDRMRSDFEALYEFAKEADEELNFDVIDGDINSLKKCMKYIRDCKRRKCQVESMITVFNDAIAMLKRHKGCVSDEEVERIEELRKPAQEVWNTLFRKSLNSREQHSSAMDREARNLKDDTFRFESDVAEVLDEMRQSKMYSYTMLRLESYTSMESWARKLLTMESESHSLLDLQELFELSPSEFKDLKEMRNELVMLKNVWDFVCHVLSMFEDWMRSPFFCVDVEGFLDEIHILQKQLKGQPIATKEWDVYRGLSDTVQNMFKSLPLCAELRTPAMRDRHWKMLFGVIGLSSTGVAVDPTSTSFTLQNLIELGIHKHSEEIYNIVEMAQKEILIEKSLQKIQEMWATLNVEYEKAKAQDTPLLANCDSIMEQLEADTNLLQSMMVNRFVEYFLETVHKWEKYLSNVDTCLVKWVEIQRKWVNLLPIFVESVDIKEQLPDDARRFGIADMLFRKLMAATYGISNVIELICTNILLERMGEKIAPPIKGSFRQKPNAETSEVVIPTAYRDLEHYLQTIENVLIKCEKALSDYLEMKRKIFPRFFFVSSADLVDILSKGSHPKSVMIHMTKIVDSIDTFLFDPLELSRQYLSNPAISLSASSPISSSPNFPVTAHPKAVYAIESIQGEIVRLSKQYICEGPVETWLAGCIKAMQAAVRTHIAEAVMSYADRPRTEWIYLHPCQAIIVASRGYFTAETATAFQSMEEGNDMAMKDHLKQQKYSLDILIKEVLTPKEDNARKMLVHLITIDVHNRDIIQSLVDDKVDSGESFAWQSQMRYYWDDNKGSEVRICDAEFTNGYEYIGLCGCLVITKLTDRCYITLSQALRLNQGGAPAGPAGTGKTETTKDLARNVGIACYVFNCSDQMNYITLGQVFKGLVMSGSWGCFDEFNRISIEVLSVVATQVSSILNALKSRKTHFRFVDEEISIINSVGIFITMNPGYAGRTELPENIKSLFRPCAMCVPDLKNICEIMLAAEGFGDAKDLALKFVTLYRLNKELLSPQDHYDWGLRAVKSVLYIAGSLKRADPEVPERRVLMRALRDTNLAKLSKDDVYVFMGLIKCLFPQLEVPKKTTKALNDALKQECKAMGNFPGDNDIFILKCMQYEEILHVRHSVFILGAAGSGKTECWRCLQGALARLGNKCVSSVLNPKAITSNELYGYIHPQTKEWKDGVLSNIFRQYALESKTKKNSKWIVLDGIVDAEWIESMNTVMDDNKMLTLVSNERIPLTDSMRMIFEVSQLRNASPATVSRGGVIFINESDLGYTPFRDKWLATLDFHTSMAIENFFDRYVPPVFEFYKRSLHTIVPIMNLAVVQTICFLLEGLLKDLKDKSTEVLEKYFAFALVWAFGGPLPSDGRIDYRYQFSSWWKKENSHLKMNENGTVFDYFVDTNDKYEFKPWSSIVKPYEFNPDLPLTSVCVETADTARMDALCSLLINNSKPVMLVGTAGTGKSNILMAKLRSLDSSTIIFRVISFNARTNAASLQAVMEQNLEKRSGRIYGPPNLKKMIFFIDDMNVPAPDKYGTQDVIALIQQHVNYGFWFDRVKMIPKEIHDIQYVGAMNPKSGTFTILDRLLRHYAVFSANMPDHQDLLLIYGQILAGHLDNFTPNIRQMTPQVVNATLDLHALVVKNFLPTAILFHYQWNMRELSNIFLGLCNSNPKLHKDVPQFVRLWAHECQRTFRDRMPSQNDAQKFDDLLAQVIRETFVEIPSEALEPKGLWAPLRTTAEGDENVYDECDEKFTQQTLISSLRSYNENVTSMELVLFDQAIAHVCRITRIMSNLRGNALLVGVGGSGKQSLSKLASHILGLEVSQILVTSTYGIANFRTDMQEIYKRCGFKGNGIAFIITDQQIMSADMLVYLNDTLNSGNIPDLFVGEDRDNVIVTIQNEVKASGDPDYSNPDVCFDYFIRKVRLYLRIILCMSPISPKFASWCRQFPALSNTTSINWFHPWPLQALQSVAHRFVASEDLGSEEAKTNIANFIADCHEMITKTAEEFFMVEHRRCYTTPKSFLETIQLYKTLLANNRAKLQKKSERLQAGIQKIQDAAVQVTALQEVLVKESIEVEEAREVTARLLETVSAEKEVVEQQREIAGAEERKTDKIVQEVEAFAAECEIDLAAARPLVEEAKAALNTLDKSHLTELKSMARPPEDVVMVCAAVRVLSSDPQRIPSAKNRDWANCKQMMGNVSTWMKDLLSFDQDNILQPCVDAIQIYINNPAFNPRTVITKSFAAAGLCKWVIGMNAYHIVRCQVRPKEQRLAEARERLDTSRRQLKKIQSKVAALQAKLDELLAQYNEANDASLAIEAKARKTRLKTELAERLVNGLSGEKVRWGKTIEILKEKSQLLVGDVLLAAAFVSYVGPFTKTFRHKIVDELWRPEMERIQVAMTKGLDPVMDLLATDADVASWENDGLQSDPVSVQNGAIVKNCMCWPLIIDPQLQAIRWIKTEGKKDNLIVIQPGQKIWLDTLINCIENGTPCLLEGCGETIDPVLDNVLGRVTYRRGNKLLMRVGARDVVYNPNFKLFLQTRLSNPFFSPELNAQTTIVNFTVTESGLEDQLLAVVVNHDRRDLEEKRATLIRNMNTMTIELQQCEDGLLQELSNAGEDILENVGLVENLEYTKKKASDINQSMVAAVATQEKISTSRAQYEASAARGALLFFQIDRLGKIDHMYQYSLEAFMSVFNKALEEAPFPENKNNIAERVQNVSRVVTEHIYAYVARGMFERHKLIVSTMMTFGIMLKSGEIDRRQVEFLLQGKKKSTSEPRPESVREWCSEACWASVLALAEVEGTSPPFSQLPQEMTDGNRWKIWQDSERPEEEKVPTDWKSLSSFQRLLILRCLRPDRLSAALEHFVSDSLGKFFISDQNVDISVSFQSSSPVNPLFFILSPGIDPVRNVEALGVKLGYTYDKGNVYNVSLGQGQELVAERALAACFKDGGWCMLSNVHLVKKWMMKFEKIIEEYAESYSKMAVIDKERAVRRAARKHAWLEQQNAKDSETRGEGGGLRRRKESGLRDTQDELGMNEEEEVEEEVDDSVFDDPEQDADLVNPNLVMGSKEFRIFLSAEPSDTIPISVLQRSLKLTSEPPTGVKQNISRALICFNDEPWEKSAKPTEYRCIMFAMCFFHAVVVERKKFGPQGWNRVYPFNLRDLTTCMEVTANYIEDRPKAPWEDLRYVFGEIMYGGHITDDWDRVLCMAYLNQWIIPAVTDGCELAGGFTVPSPMGYDEYQKYIEDNCPEESPMLYGLHPNAEINYRTVQAHTLFSYIAELQPPSSTGRASGGAGGTKGAAHEGAKEGDIAVVGTGERTEGGAPIGEAETPNEIARNIVDDLTEKLPEPFNLNDLSERLEDERTPTQHVFYQECESMNILLDCVRTSLNMMSLGLKGELSMSEEMEQVFAELILGRVPESWMRYSFASVRPLATWFDSLLQRYNQCNDWTNDLQNPKVILLNLFFNPMSLLTALMQQTSICNSYDLDQMGLLFEPTKKVPEQIDVPARDGAFIYGLILEGARWDANNSCVEESRPKELYPKIPVVCIRALPLGKLDRRDQYECPMYKTQTRGPSFVVGLWLKTKMPPRRWTIQGVGILLDVAE